MKLQYRACLTDKPILYSFRRCPYAMRARMALAAANIDVEHREVALRNKPDIMVLASPKATVPVLVLPDTRVIDESLDIMRWALGQNDPLGWDTTHDALIDDNDGPFKYHLDRMKYAHRFEGADPAAHRTAAAPFLAALEARLEASSYLCGDEPGFTDIAVMPFVRQFARADLDAWAREPLPRLQSWLTLLIGMPIFHAIMVKHPLWTDVADQSKDSI